MQVIVLNPHKLFRRQEASIYGQLSLCNEITNCRLYFGDITVFNTI